MPKLVFMPQKVEVYPWAPQFAVYVFHVGFGSRRHGRSLFAINPALNFIVVKALRCQICHSGFLRPADYIPDRIVRATHALSDRIAAQTFYFA
jgi:hypothetical protein